MIFLVGIIFSFGSCVYINDFFEVQYNGFFLFLGIFMYYVVILNIIEVNNIECKEYVS